MSFEMSYGREGQPKGTAPVIPEETVAQPLEDLLAAPEVEQQESEPVQEEVIAAKSQETPAQQNMKILRQQAEQAQRERDQMAQRLAEYESMRNQQQPVKQQEQPEDNEVNLAPDELAEGKHLSKVARKIQNLEKKLAQYEQQTSEQVAESRLKMQYPDFDKVVSADNIAMLRNLHPEIASTLNASSSDLYSKAVSAYTMIKRLGIHVEDTYDTQKSSSAKECSSSQDP